MSKNKKIAYFSIPIFMTIYQLYLINRIWHFSTRVSLFIFTILLGLTYIGFYLFYKKIKFNNVKKRNFVIITIISIVLSGYVLGTNFDFFSKAYKENNIEIYFENPKVNLINSIKNVYVDNSPIEIENHINENILRLNLKACKDTNIIFLLNEENKNQKIIIKDGDVEKNIVLKDNYHIYTMEGNKSFNLNSLIRSIISFFMIEIISIMLCIASYKMYKNNKTIIIPTLILILAIRIFMYQQNQLCVKYEDSYDYQTCNLSKIIETKTLQDRVPIYPLLIQFLEFICKDMWAYFLCIIQMIISFISLVYLYKTLKLIIKNKVLCSIIVFLYGTSTAIFGWDTNILTESLSLSIVVIFCYFLISYLKKNTLKYGIGSTMIALLLCFLRPSCIVFIPILLVFYILKIFLEKENRSNNIKCLISVFSIIAILLVYAFAYYKQHNIFSITSASVRQDLYVCMHEGFYKNSGDNQFINDVEKEIKENKLKWDSVTKILKKYGNERIIKLTKESKKNSFKDYIKYLTRVIKEQTIEKFRSYNQLLVPEMNNKLENVIYKVFEEFFIIKFSTIFIIVVIEGIIGFYKWIKEGKPSWIHLGLFGFIFVILVTAFIGTNAEFMRTSICSLPFVYISIALLISDSIERYKLEK